MTDKIYKNENGVDVELLGDELAEYQAMQDAWASGSDDRKKQKIRQKRKDLLSEADWQIHKIEDASGDPSAWRTYRQALRDITSGDLDNPTWPTKPN